MPLGRGSSASRPLTLGSTAIRNSCPAGSSGQPSPAKTDRDRVRVGRTAPDGWPSPLLRRSILVFTVTSQRRFTTPPPPRHKYHSKTTEKRCFYSLRCRAAVCSFSSIALCCCVQIHHACSGPSSPPPLDLDLDTITCTSTCSPRHSISLALHLTLLALFLRWLS